MVTIVSIFPNRVLSLILRGRQLFNSSRESGDGLVVHLDLGFEQLGVVALATWAFTAFITETLQLFLLSRSETSIFLAIVVALINIFLLGIIASPLVRTTMIAFGRDLRYVECLLLLS